MHQLDTDTICAIATPPGRSGVGIIRVSGALAQNIARDILGFAPTHRHAYYSKFLGIDRETIDQGIAIFFQQPNSFTGEDVLELHGHGGVYVLNALRDRVLSLGVRLARPGEFTERSFLNDKIDLVQAEAIADLIDANSEQAAKSAMRTLQGDFSRRINDIVEKLIATRVNIEAAIDFSDEDIDVLSDTKVKQALDQLLDELHETYTQAKQGALLKEGMNVVIAGKPNVGKSSLLNALSGLDSAIVTNVPGTTRDLLKEHITIDGMPIHMVDTAGLRSSDDVVEREGVKRAQAAIDQADQVLLVIDVSESEEDVENLLKSLGLLNDKSNSDRSILNRTTLIFNKIDLIPNNEAGIETTMVRGTELTIVKLSAKERMGLDLLKQHLKACIGYNSSEEGVFVARERHLVALRNAERLLKTAVNLINKLSPLELVAEELRIAQTELGTITGKFTSDDLLGEIFSSFCVGK